MIDCKIMFENRKLATFYMKEERTVYLKTSLEVDHELSSMFNIRFSDRTGKEALP